MSEITVKSQSLSETFYTVDTYGQFSTDYLDDNWFEESEFDSKGFMQDLAELHCEVINNVLPAGGIKSVKLIDTSSPQFYNFQTDQAYLEIDVDVDQLYRYLQMHDNEKEFGEFLNEHFTSRSGFWSFTPNNLRDFYGAVDGTSEEYNQGEDRDKCVTILAGWYLTRECLTEDEYLDAMYDRLSEVMWNHFEQFTDATWNEYNEYEEEFNRLKATQLEFEGFPPSHMYLMDIEEWYKEVKLKEIA